MPDLVDFPPAITENIRLIRIRMNSWANLGLTPDDLEWIDLTPAGVFWDLTQVALFEFERLYSKLAVEIPAISTPLFAYGQYLDYHAEAAGLERKDATPATGKVTFSGTDGSTIPVGARVGVSVTPDDIDLTFRTTESAVIAVGTATVAIVAERGGSDLNVPEETIDTALSPLPGVSSVMNEIATSGGTDVESDPALSERLLRNAKGSKAGGTLSSYELRALTHPGVGVAVAQPHWAGPGTVRVVVGTFDGDPVSTGPESTLDLLQRDLDPVTDGAVVTQLNGAINSAILTLTVDSTSSLEVRGVVKIDDEYIAYTGKTPTTLTGCSRGQYASVPASHLDDASLTKVTAAEGRGFAFSGAAVSAVTWTTVGIDVSATVITLPGFSVDGTAGTIDVSEPIRKQIRNYINNLPVGYDVLLNAVEARFFRVRGVYDVEDLELNGAAADVPIDGLATFPETAQADDLGPWVQGAPPTP